MRHARMFVLLAVAGQSACCGGTRVLPAVPAADSEEGTKFLEERPALPSETPCLDHPMARYWYVSSTWRDPKHSFVPGRHYALDFPAPVGTPVTAVADGEVTEVAPVEPGKDAYVKVRFAEDWGFGVNHLSRVDVVQGQKVSRGERLGLSGGKVGADGSGPWTTGPHLHFSVTYKGLFVNPITTFCDPQP